MVVFIFVLSFWSFPVVPAETLEDIPKILQAEYKVLRNELREEFKCLRDELRAEFESLRDLLKS